MVKLLIIKYENDLISFLFVVFFTAKVTPLALYTYHREVKWGVEEEECGGKNCGK